MRYRRPLALFSARPLLAALLLAVLFQAAGCKKEEALPTDPVAAGAVPWIKQLENGDQFQRREAIEKLAAIDHEIVYDPLVKAALYDIQLELRVRAVRALGRPKVLKDPKPLIDLLGSPDSEVRLACCDVLGKLKVVAAEDALADSIRDREPFVRLAALQALSQLGPSGLARLERMFSEGSLEERTAIADVFGRSGDKSRVPLLCKALGANEDQIRRTAAESLGRLKDDQAVAPLVALTRTPLSDLRHKEFDTRLEKKPTPADYASMIALLDADMVADGRRPGGASTHRWLMDPARPDAHKGVFKRLIEQQRRDAGQVVRQAAIGALADIGTPVAQAAVVQLLGDTDELIAGAAKRVLTGKDNLHGMLHGLVKDSSQPAMARIRAVQLLIHEAQESSGPQTGSALLEAIKLSDEGKFVSKTPPPKYPWLKAVKPTAEMTAPLDDRLKEQLLAGLNDKDPAFRAYCAKLLAVRKVDKAAEPLIGLLDSPEPLVRSAVIEAIGNFKDPRATPKVVAILRDKKSSEYHKQAIEALGLIGDKAGVPALLAVATDVNNDLCTDALRSIGMIGDGSAAKPLLDFLARLDTITPATTQRNIGWVKNHVVEALGRIKATEAVPVLLSIVNVTNARGGGLSDAIEALGNIGDRSAVPVIIERVRKGPYHVKAERHINYTTNAGVNALVKLGDPRAVPLFVSLVDNPPDPFTREYAFRGLGELKTAEAVEHLVKLLVDPKIDPGIKDADVGPALAAQGTNAKAAMLKVLVETPTRADDAIFDAGIYAAQLLSLMGADAVPDLAKITQTRKEKHVLARAIEALQRIDHDDAVTALGGLLDAKQPSEVRQWAVVALGKSKRPSALRLAESIKSDPDPEVSKWAQWAIQQLKG